MKQHGAILGVFALTAVAIAAANRLPREKDLAPLALLLDIAPVCGVLAATAFATMSFRRVSRSPMHLIAAAYSYLAGGVVGAFGVAHTVAVIVAAAARARHAPFQYSFRLYSLLLLGALLIGAGLLSTMKAEGLARGHQADWRASLFVWTALLLINLPLVPLQGFAVLFSALAAVALAALTGIRRRCTHA